MTITNAGIEYTLPTAHLLQHSGLGTSEYAGRTAYASFDKSENSIISYISKPGNIVDTATINELNSIDHSDLLDSLAWVHHHHSVLEHCNLTYLIKGISRGVLQELVRHRIASYTVRSTRYTMQSVLNAFVASYGQLEDKDVFLDLIRPMNLFVTLNEDYNAIEIDSMFNKLVYQIKTIGYANFIDLALSKDAQELFKNFDSELPIERRFELLESAKSKRNVGDAFKHIVTDNWYTDLVMTMNLRSLKNFFELRDSGAAYFLIRELAKQMKLETPEKYLKLIRKDMKD